MEIKHYFTQTTIFKYRADLRGADLRGVDLRGVDLCGANLCGANLCGANLCGADLCGADLCGANLCGANLCGANLCGANLCGANLCGADLCGANLCGADLYRTNLYRADLTNITMNWTSHTLIAQQLLNHSKTLPNQTDSLYIRTIAGLILISTDWCWDEFIQSLLTLSHATDCLTHLKTLVRPNDNHPPFLD